MRFFFLLTWLALQVESGVAQQLLKPLDPYVVSGYSFAEEFTDDLGRHRHLGEDLHATFGVGTPIRAIADGTIILSRTNRPGYGQYVVISHSSPFPFVSVYGHLSRQLQYPMRGEGPVRQSDIIGYIGSQDENGGWTPHLHFAIYKKAPDGTYHYWGNAPNDTGDDVDVDAQGKVVGGFFTKPSTFSPPTVGTTITFTFTGVVTHVVDFSGILGNTVIPGTTLFGTFTYGLDATDIFPNDPTLGFYGYSAGTSKISVTVNTLLGPKTVTTDISARPTVPPVPQVNDPIALVVQDGAGGIDFLGELGVGTAATWQLPFFDRSTIAVQLIDSHTLTLLTGDRPPTELDLMRADDLIPGNLGQSFIQGGSSLQIYVINFRLTTLVKN